MPQAGPLDKQLGNRTGASRMEAALKNHLGHLKVVAVFRN
jgi:hypothetical protein